MPSIPERFDQEALWAELNEQRDLLLGFTLAPPFYSGSPTGRGIEEVARMQGYELDDFLEAVKGKRVLDVGGGYSSLSLEAAARGVKSHIVAYDLPAAYLGEDEWARDHVKSGQEIAGFAQALPFPDRSFDLVFSTFALPLYANSKHQIDGFINESLRVLKPEGKLSIYPLLIWGQNCLEPRIALEAHMLDKIVELNEHQDYTVQLTAPPDEFGAGSEPGVVIEKLR